MNKILCALIALGAVVLVAHADTPRVPGALVIAQCNYVMGLVLTDEKGDLHPVDISKMTVEQVRKIAESSEHVVQATLPCPHEDETL